MSTPFYIGRGNDDGTYDCITVHWDGFLSTAGPILLNHYKTDESINELIALGDLSVLGKSTSNCGGHTFDTPLPNRCIAYGRDRRDQQQAKWENGAGYIDYRAQTMDLGFVQCLSPGITFLFRKGDWYFMDKGETELVLLSTCCPVGESDAGN
jgi:hypothetical protein